MKTLLLHSCAFLALAASAPAEIIGVEQFDYPDGPIATKGGGTFWDYKNFTPTGHTGFVSNWDNVAGAPAVASGRLVTDNSSAKREYNGTSPGATTDDFAEAAGAVNDPASVPSSVAKSVYYRVTLTTGATLPDFFGLSSYDFGNEKLFFGRRSGQAKFGIDETGVSGTDSTTTPDILPNTTYTLVARIDYNTNLLRLFVNPDLNATEDSQLTAANRTYTGTNWSTNIRLASGTGGSVAWDDLVVATTWDDLGTVVTTTADEDDGPASLNTPADISLREAVKYSPAGSFITFATALNGQTCTLGLGEMAIEKPLTLDGSALANGVTIDANRATRHFVINGSTASLTLKSLSLINGNGVGAGSDVGGAIYLVTGDLFLQRCTLSGNFAENAGAIWQQGGGTSRLEECTITGNRATVNAGLGGIAVLLGTCTLSRCTISGNTGTGAGGGLFLQSPASVSLSNCLIAGNTDSFDNDFSRAGGTLTPSGSNLIGSNASVSGIFSPGPLVGTQSSPLDPKLSPLGYFGGPVQTMHPLIGSPAIDAGGTTNPGGTDQRGLPRFVDGDASTVAQLDIGAVEAGPLFTVAGGPFTNLRAVLLSIGAGVPGAHVRFDPAVYPRTITLSGGDLMIPAGANIFIDASDLTGPVTLSGNNAFPSRVFNIEAGATLAVHSLKIVKGQAGGGDGGGVHNSGFLTMIRTTISNNRGRIGGGLFNQSTGLMLLDQCTIAGNAADGSYNGGGLHNRGRLRVNQSTVTGNSAFGGGGIDNGFGGSWTVEQSTIAGNSASSSGGGIYTFMGTNVLKHSIVAANTAPAAPNTAGTFESVGTNLTSGDPLLAPLSDYGGPTFTMLPLPGSPAINAATGSTATRDQRGLPMNGTPDIGAVEAQAALTGLVDTDSDGMDDRLEVQYGFLVGANDGDLDADGDGSINRDELGNKTGPRDPASLMKILTFSKTGDNVNLTWTSFPGLSYTLEYGSTLSFGGTVGLGTASGMTFGNTVGPFTDPKAFMRIRRD